MGAYFSRICRSWDGLVSLFLQHALTVEGARITYPDKMASNGIIHRIEKVLMPPVGNIVDVLTKDGSFNTLLAAANAAGLVEALKGKAYNKWNCL